eukprot:SAG31_NODE_829_length_11709_cov_5.435917_8_plen_234_part_00
MHFVEGVFIFVCSLLPLSGGALRNRGASMEDPFFHACVSGNIANVSRLSEKNEQDPHKLRHRWDTPGGSWIRSDVTPLWAACYCGHLLVVKFLIAECGTDATIVTRDMKETPFWVACFKGHRAIVEYLVEAANERGFLDHGIHGTTVDGWTPLFGACYMGHLDVIKYLCEELEVNPLQVNGLGQVCRFHTQDSVLISTSRLPIIAYFCAPAVAILGFLCSRPTSSCPILSLRM